MGWYELPEVLGGSVIEADEIWGGWAGSRPEYRLADDITILAPKGRPFGEVGPPVPAEPPDGTRLLGLDGATYERHDDWAATYGEVRWYNTNSSGPDDWERVWRDAKPTTHLVPGPFAEPVEHPWESEGPPYFYISGVDQDSLVGFTVGLTLDTSDGYSLSTKRARDMARALWAAADAAEARP